MKIAFIGINNLLVPFASALAQAENEVTVFNGLPFSVINPKCKTIWKKYRFFGLTKVLEMIFPETSLPFYFSHLVEDLQKESPDKIVVMDFIRLWFIQVIAYKKKNPKCKVFLYTETKHFPQNPLSRAAFWFFLSFLKRNIAAVEKIFVYTNEGKVFLSEYLPKEKIVLVPIPVDTEMFYPENEKEMDDGLVRILMNARFVAFKNHKDALQALSLLNAEEKQKIRLSLVGAEGDTYESTKKLITELRLENVVCILPSVPLEKIRQYYIENDVLLLPSSDEAVGRVVPEAMACGLATITSDTVGANVYVAEEETGLIFKTGDVQALADIYRDLAAGKVEYHRMGISAAKKIKNEFSEEIQIKMFLTEIAS